MTFIRQQRLMTFVLSLAVLFYAVPRLPLQWEGTLPNWFAFFWLVFAFLVVAANWRAVLGIDREQRREERVKRFGFGEWQRHQQDRRQSSYFRSPRRMKQKATWG